MFKKSSSLVKFFFLPILFFILQCKSEPQSTLASSAKRTPTKSVEKEKKIQEINNGSKEISSKKYLYITFDDGPNKGTSNVIKSLQKEKVPATLFLVGSHIQGSKAQWEDYQTIAEDSLFQIANHSYFHAKNKFKEFYQDSIKVLEDFTRMNDSLNRKLMVARTPGRNIWRIDSIDVTDLKSSKNAADYLAKNDFVLVGWDLEWKANSDYKIQETGEELLKQIDSAFEKKQMQTENHLVLLTHDQYFRDEESVKELDSLLQKLKTREDIQLMKIKDYPGIGTQVY
jgi:peptidoglycan/xylan/chitin deacetylase (PgdA/CDA1 family)